MENSACGIDLEDGDSKLLDLRFADDILLFARTKAEAIFMLETLMEELACVGLCLNASKTVVLTNEAQPPSCLILTNQEAIVCESQQCRTQMVGVYSVSWRRWEVQLWTSPFIYKRPQGRSLPTNRFSVTRRFALQFGFVSLTGSLHLLPFLLLAIEQSG